MVLIDTFKEYAVHIVDFKGRMDRRTYWFGYLAIMIVDVILCLLGMIPYLGWFIFLPIACLYSGAATLAYVSATIRRLRDIGEPWQKYFMTLIPVYGTIWWIQNCVKPSAD